MPDRLLRINAYTTLDMADVSTLRRAESGTTSADDHDAGRATTDNDASRATADNDASRATADHDAGRATADHDAGRATAEVETLGVVNVTAARRDPEEVRLELEADHAETALDAHAERVHLSPAEAEELADALQKHAGRVRAAANGDEEE
jgi:hypothetical protein